MHNWDLYIVGPVVVLLSLCALMAMFWREKIKGKALIFYVEIIIAWTVNGFLAKILYQNVVTAFDNNVNNLGFTFMVLISSFIISAILKPLATKITGILKNRKIWMWIAYGTTGITIILTMLNPNNDLIAIYFVSVFLFGFSLSSSSLYYLFLNEQHYHRVNSISISFFVGLTMAFATFLGIYIQGINLAFYKDTNMYWILGVLFGLTATALGISFVKKENSLLIASFVPEILENLKKSKASSLVLLVFVAFIVSLAEQLTNGIFNNLTISLLLRHRYSDGNTINSILNTMDFLMFGVVTIFGYLAYKLILRHVGMRVYFIINAFAAAFVAILHTFVNNGIALLIMNVVSSFFFSQVLYSLFATAIFQNYRRNNVPVTGYVAGAFAFGVYCDDLVENLIIKNQLSVFSKYQTIDDIINNYHSETFKNDYNDLNAFLVAGYCVAICLMLISIIIIYFRANDMFAEYQDIKQAEILQKNILKQSLPYEVNTLIKQKEKREI